MAFQSTHRRHSLLSRPNPGGARVASDALAGGDLMVYDSTTGEWLTGTALTNGVTVTGGNITALAGNAVRIQDSGNTDSLTMSHTGTDVDFVFVNTTSLKVRDGVTLRVYDSSDTDYIEVKDNGTNASVVTNNNAIQLAPGNDLLQVVTDGEALRVDANSTSGNTRLLIYDVDNSTLERVSVGAADSGGTNYKVLRIPN